MNRTHTVFMSSLAFGAMFLVLLGWYLFPAAYGADADTIPTDPKSLVAYGVGLLITSLATGLPAYLQGKRSGNTAPGVDEKEIRIIRKKLHNHGNSHIRTQGALLVLDSKLDIIGEKLGVNTGHSIAPMLGPLVEKPDDTEDSEPEPVSA